MKMVTHIMIVLLAGSMLFALAGCGGEQAAAEEGGVPSGQIHHEGEASPGEPSKGEGEQTDDAEEAVMYLYINGNALKVVLAENSATAALVQLLRRGDIQYTADDYGGFEKVGALGHALPTSNVQVTTQPGDVMLYQGDQIVIFYGSNSWSYTPLGRIEGYSADALGGALGAGAGRLQVRLSLE